MGGDHKCPVCNSTFTRPQHVARHMRSHTGDRPYKCQVCGDQFARSDLLARHVNKCHPSEKPLLPPAAARRKGSASASRATTSKQACDQCVQNSLPCDGANPCAKCCQRKLRCTFVKFHRQTAPVGPGHVPPSPSRDDFNPSLTVPSMAENLFSDAFMFTPTYLDNTPTESADFSSRYRARADLLRRNDEHNTPAHHFPDPHDGWGGTWDHTRYAQEKIHRHQPQHQYPPIDTSTVYRHSIQRPKPEFEQDLDYSDGSASSIPSSAGSEVHLPLPPDEVTGAFNGSDPIFAPFQPFHPSSSFHSTTNIIHSTSAVAASPSNSSETFDESTFRALSLDDPALIATAAPPFFPDVLDDTTSDFNTTPMPPHPAEGDGNLWRAFMHSTPVGEQPHREHHARRATVSNIAHPYHRSSAHPQEKHSRSSQPSFHQPRYVSHTLQQTQQPDDLSRYHQAVLARARENETVLRPPPDARQRPRRFEHGTGFAVHRERPGSSGSSASAGTSVSELVGTGEGDGLGGQGHVVRPGVKRGLSNAMQGEPESKRRIAGEERRAGRAID
ncbi:Zinc finger protein [Termitomyces sp. T112]|nr:Zinc finger protein [Termitomyces sp. T112]